MTRIAFLLAAGAAIATAPAALAQPCVDVELSFDPGSAAIHDRVELSASIANPGDEGGLAELSVALSYNEHDLGPLEVHRYLAAGKEIGVTVGFRVPPVLEPGTLGITLEASLGECHDSATATLTIEEGDALGADAPDLAGLGNALLQGLFQGPTPTRPATWGSLKARYR